MTKLKIIIGIFDTLTDDGYYFAGENFIDDDLIVLDIAQFDLNNNNLIEDFVRKFNWLYLSELFCLYGQMHDTNFLKDCMGGNKQSNCKIDKILDFIELYY